MTSDEMSARTAGLQVGELVRDKGRDMVGVIMGHEGPYVQLRPVGGGREWDANPEKIQPVDSEEALSAKVTRMNQTSRRQAEINSTRTLNA